MIGNSLAYVSVIVRDVAAVAAILEERFHLKKTDCTVGSSGRRNPVFSVGRTGIALFEPGDQFVGGAERVGVHHLAVAVDGPVSAATEAAQHGVRTVSYGPEWGLAGTQRVLLEPKATGGVVTYLSEPLRLAPPDTSVVERIDHLGVASEDNKAVVDVYSRVFGWPVESSQTDAEFSHTIESFTSDKYGVTYRSGPPELIGGVRVAFVTVGDCDLEFLQNLQPNTEALGQGPGSTRQDQNVIARYINSRGPSLHHVALKVRDVNSLLASLEAAGLTLIDRVGRPGSRLAQIGFIHPASLGGMLVHLVQREEVASS